MSGSILILDSVATNRIVLRVKMTAAQFQVTSCATEKDAHDLIARNRPDLILVNLSDLSEDRHAFCTALKAAPDTASIPIIAVGLADTARARLAALDAGADDVLAHPLHDALLLARIRSLLRAWSVTDELALRDGTCRALGFAEAATGFDAPGKVAVIAPLTGRLDPQIAGLNAYLPQPLMVRDIASVLRGPDAGHAPDLFIIPAGQRCRDQAALFGLVSDLRSRIDTRHAALLVIGPDDAPDMAALFLDLGADDVVPQAALPQEIARRVNVLVRRKLLHDALRRDLRDGLQAAVTDPLTGLYNRRYVDHHLARLAAEKGAGGQGLAVMMVDIDHFKAINDRFGHAAGDRVLVAVASRLRDNLRAVDLVARVGGEEFLIAMPRSTPRQAEGAAKRLCRIISATPFDLGEAHRPVTVTISVGVALCDDGTLPDRACDLADAALYRAKSAGRDRVMMDMSMA